MDTPFPLDTPLPFHGVDNLRFKNRSALGSVAVHDGVGIFFGTPVDTVTVVPLNESQQYDPYRTEFAGWVVKSTSDGHEWLRFGTENYSDYCPGFVFRYSPRTEAK
jgi:hypothetical protein